MNWFRPDEDKAMRNRRKERDSSYQDGYGWERERRSYEEDDENAEERREYIRELEDELTAKDSDIITIYLCDDDCAWRKQIALNFMLKNGYICVQNDVSCTQYSRHYDLTFVKKEHADFFKIG